jgi:hypothetical protein
MFNHIYTFNIPYILLGTYGVFSTLYLVPSMSLCAKKKKIISNLVSFNGISTMPFQLRVAISLFVGNILIFLLFPHHLSSSLVFGHACFCHWPSLNHLQTKMPINPNLRYLVNQCFILGCYFKTLDYQLYSWIIVLV